MSAPFIRTERAPVLLVFGLHAARMADLVRLRPSLLTRLAYAPRPAMHATGAWLHLAPDVGRSDSEVAAILDESEPRDLLRAAVPDAPASLYRALDGAGDRVRERGFYERVAAACRTPFGDWLLGGDLDDARLSHTEALLNMDPFVAAMHAALPNPLYLARSVDAVLAFLRSHDALAEAELRLPPRAGLRAILRRLQRALDGIPAPFPGFALDPPHRLVGTVGELRRLGAELGNCVADPRAFATDHWFRLLDGSTVFISCDEPAFLASLRRVGPNLWRLDQVSGAKNGAVGEQARDRLIGALRAAGARVLDHDPSHALSSLWSCAERRRDADDGLEDELADDVAA